MRIEHHINGTSRTRGATFYGNGLTAQLCAAADYIAENPREITFIGRTTKPDEDTRTVVEGLTIEWKDTPEELAELQKQMESTQ